MTEQSDHRRFEPSLDELLDDDMMGLVLRSAGFDPPGFREMIAQTARRLDPLGAPDGEVQEC